MMSVSFCLLLCHSYTCFCFMVQDGCLGPRHHIYILTNSKEKQTKKDTSINSTHFDNIPSGRNYLKSLHLATRKNLRFYYEREQPRVIVTMHKDVSIYVHRNKGILPFKYHLLTLQLLFLQNEKQKPAKTIQQK